MTSMTKPEDAGFAAPTEPGRLHHEVPPLPPGRIVTIANGGEVFVRDIPGPPSAPTLVLLHGWMATAAFRVDS